MIRVRPFAVPFLAFGIAITSSVTLASTLEEEYIALAGWCPGLAGPSIQDEHGQWHTIGFGATQGKEFVEFHDEFLAQSDDFRLYGSDLDAADPDAAVIPVVAQAGSVLKFAHTNLNGCVRPAGDNVTLAHAHVGPCGVASAWTPRPADLRLRNVLFHGYDANGIGGAMDGLFHGAGHGTIAAHNRVGAANGDMGFTTTATRDGAFFQWHKNIDNIYHEWAVGQYQGVANTGTPIFFSVVNTAVGAGVGAGASALRLRRETNEYQGTNPPVDVDFDGVLDQYGAIPRIPSDIYVGDINSSNLLFDYGIRRWNTLDAWDKDAFTILNPPGSGWYFSVTTTSVGALLTAVNAQAAAARGECVFESAGAGTNTLYRTGPDLGLLAAASDNLDALEVDQQKRIQATNDSNIAGIYDRPKQWFSLRSGSEFGVKALGGAAVGPCDILQFNANGDLVIAVTAATLGLAAAGNELDALVIVDTAPLDTLN